ncbi:MAG: hypothetical protein RH978_04880 [Roseitalea porphyridii]|uniref:hypothetical protein n=1 Tax=Roseitalea porphyridii TaxID=1852022 RepID=UPI0032EB1F77
MNAMIGKIIAFSGFLMSAFCSLGWAGETCEGPETGGVISGGFDFTYESWIKERTDTGKWRFERCVRNSHVRPLWFTWKSAGFSAGVVKGDDASRIYFDEVLQDKDDRATEFWYGPRPEKIEPATVLRPSEISWMPVDGAVVWKAQVRQSDGLVQAFADKELFVGYLTQSAADGLLTLSSGGRIAVPVRDDALSDLADSESQVTNDDFVSVNVSIAEIFSLDENQEPVARLRFVASVDGPEFSRMLELGYKLPEIVLSTEMESLTKRLGLSDLQLSEPRLVAEESSPVPVLFPAKRTEGVLVVEFGDGLARLALPFGMASGN